MRTQRLVRTKQPILSLTDKLNRLLESPDLSPSDKSIIYDAKERLAVLEAKTRVTLSFDYEPTQERIELSAPSERCFAVFFQDPQIYAAIQKARNTPPL